MHQPDRRPLSGRRALLREVERRRREAVDLRDRDASRPQVPAATEQRATRDGRPSPVASHTAPTATTAATPASLDDVVAQAVLSAVVGAHDAEIRVAERPHSVTASGTVWDGADEGGPAATDETGEDDVRRREDVDSADVDSGDIDDSAPEGLPTRDAAPLLVVEARDLETALAEIADRLGPDAQIVDVARQRTGGLGGFFGREVVTVHVLPPAEAVTSAGVPAAAALAATRTEASDASSRRRWGRRRSARRTAVEEQVEPPTTVPVAEVVGAPSEPVTSDGPAVVDVTGQHETAGPFDPSPRPASGSGLTAALEALAEDETARDGHEASSPVAEVGTPDAMRFRDLLDDAIRETAPDEPGVLTAAMASAPSATASAAALAPDPARPQAGPAAPVTVTTIERLDGDPDASSRGSSGDGPDDPADTPGAAVVLVEPAAADEHPGPDVDDELSGVHDVSPDDPALDDVALDLLAVLSGDADAPPATPSTAATDALTSGEDGDDGDEASPGTVLEQVVADIATSAPVARVADLQSGDEPAAESAAPPPELQPAAVDAPGDTNGDVAPRRPAAGRRWRLGELRHLDLPAALLARLDTHLAGVDDTDDLGVLEAVARAVEPWVGLAVPGRHLVVGPGAAAVGAGLDLPIASLGGRLHEHRTASLTCGDDAVARGDVAAARAGRHLTVAVTGAGHEGLLRLRPTAVASVGLEGLLVALDLAVERGLAWSHHVPEAGCRARPVTAVDVAVSLRDVLVEERPCHS